MDNKKYFVVSGALFTLVALAHLLRIVDGVSIQVNDVMVPMWVSWIGTALPALLALWAFRMVRQPG